MFAPQTALLTHSLWFSLCLCSVCEQFLSELLTRILAEKRSSPGGGYVQPHEVERALGAMLGAQEAELIHAAGRWSEPARQPKGQRAWAPDEQDLAAGFPAQAEEEGRRKEEEGRERGVDLAGWTLLNGGWKCSPDGAWFYHPGSLTWLEQGTGTYYRQSPSGNLEAVGDATPIQRERDAIVAGAWERRHALEGTLTLPEGARQEEDFAAELRSMKVVAARNECRKKGLMTIP